MKNKRQIFFKNMLKLQDNIASFDFISIQKSPNLADLAF